MRNHKLYLKDAKGKSLGYLSFADNRLYYVLVPLFEERRVQIMIMQNPEMNGKNSNTDLIVWIKFLPNESTMPEVDYNEKIRRLLEVYTQ